MWEVAAQGCEYKEAEVIGDHLEGWLPHLPWLSSHSMNQGTIIGILPAVKNVYSYCLLRNWEITTEWVCRHTELNDRWTWGKTSFITWLPWASTLISGSQWVPQELILAQSPCWTSSKGLSISLCSMYGHCSKWLLLLWGKLGGDTL